jgi:hypothetical protein
LTDYKIGCRERTLYDWDKSTGHDHHEAAADWQLATGFGHYWATHLVR